TEGIQGSFPDGGIKSGNTVLEVVGTPYPTTAQWIFVIVPCQRFNIRRVDVGKPEYGAVAGHYIYVDRHAPPRWVDGVERHAVNAPRCIELCATKGFLRAHGVYHYQCIFYGQPQVVGQGCAATHGEKGATSLGKLL